MADRIKITSRRLPKIVSTSPKLRRIEGKDVARSLGAERVEESSPEVVMPSEVRSVEDLTPVNERR
jgi:hypothetical protein